VFTEEPKEVLTTVQKKVITVVLKEVLTLPLKKVLDICNLESTNAVLIREGLSQSERLIRLNKVAITQLTSLLDNDHIKSFGDRVHFERVRFLVSQSVYFGHQRRFALIPCSRGSW
jgi:hypothetical protein